MGKRLRLAQGLADGTLSGFELEEAKKNQIVLQESERIKKENEKKIPKRVVKEK
jgi:hypothetical protein